MADPIPDPISPDEVQAALTALALVTGIPSALRPLDVIDGCDTLLTLGEPDWQAMFAHSRLPEDVVALQKRARIDDEALWISLHRRMLLDRLMILFRRPEEADARPAADARLAAGQEWLRHILADEARSRSSARGRQAGP